MQNINWEMMTQFVFPEQCGIVEEILTVDIKPIWQQVETDDSVRLVGIYHIAAVARFNPNGLPEYCEGTLIDQLEFDGHDGYFEYALPLEVDLPREKVAEKNQPQVYVNDVSFFVYDGSSCTFKWGVDCKFEESVEGALFKHEPIIEPVPVLEKPSNELFPIKEEFQLVDESPEETKVTEELRFGYDGIFPEQPEQPNLSELKPIIEENKYFIESFYTEGQTVPEASPHIDEYKAIEPIAETKLAPDFELSRGTVENVGEPPVAQPKVNEQKKEKVVESNQYFPTDTDDFYNELTESYTLLNVSNKIRYE